MMRKLFAVWVLGIICGFILYAYMDPSVDVEIMEPVCTTRSDLERAVWEIKDEVIENHLALIILGDEFDPALKVPERKPL